MEIAIVNVLGVSSSKEESNVNVGASTSSGNPPPNNGDLRINILLLGIKN